MNQPTGELTHNGENFTYHFVSGAECSLLAFSFESNFEGVRLDNTVNVVGFGNSLIKSTRQVKASVIVDGIGIDILFHIVPDQYLAFPIVVGREIISKHLTMTVTKTKCMLTKYNVGTASSVKVEVNTMDGDHLLGESDL
uniref:Uncharacterized protein n=1 Tax=Cacopsylla melanoneura TaxID=428564 RepID=A0A8D9FFW1_9HEMI